MGSTSPAMGISDERDQGGRRRREEEQRRRGLDGPLRAIGRIERVEARHSDCRCAGAKRIRRLLDGVEAAKNASSGGRRYEKKERERESDERVERMRRRWALFPARTSSTTQAPALKTRPWLACGERCPPPGLGRCRPGQPMIAPRRPGLAARRPPLHPSLTLACLLV